MAQEFTLVERVKEILPVIESRRFECEKLRMAHPENIKLLKEIGYIRAFQPKKWGGMEVSLREFCEATALLAGACGGTTWAAQLLNTHQHQLALFSEQAQTDVWGDDPLATASSSIAPFGKAEEVDGGVMFSGNLTWSSGCDHSEWAICGFLREGAKVNPARHQHFALIPCSDYEIIDDWHAMAMKGSGTKTLKIENVFVPEHRIQSAQALMTGQSDGWGMYPESEIYFSAYRPYFACGFAAISLGIAEKMIEWFKERSKNRIRAYTGASVGQDVPAYMRLAESQHQVNAARALLEKDWDDLTEMGKKQALPSTEQLANWRTNQAYAVKMCVAAVDRLFESSGANAWFLVNDAQRLFRESHMTAAHAYTDYDVCKQIYGRHLLGMDPDPRLL